MMEAKPTLHKTIVSGVISFTAIPTKKNEPPHIIDRMKISPHSLIPMTLLMLLLGDSPLFLLVV